MRTNFRLMPRLGLLGAIALLAACTPPAGEAPMATSPARLQTLSDPAPLLAGPFALSSCTPVPATPTPGPSAPSIGTLTIIGGKVYDPAGQLADKAGVRCTSLDPSVPYIASALTEQGQWVINNLPEGATIEIYAFTETWVSPRYLFKAEHWGRNTLDLKAEPLYPAPDSPATSPSGAASPL